MAAVGHVDFGHLHPASCNSPTGPAHVTVHVNRGVTCAPEPVVARGSSGAELLYLLTGDSRVAGGASRKIQEVKLGYDGESSCSNEFEILVMMSIVVC